MSRSYKKHPISKDNQRGGAKIGKRFAAHRIRNLSLEEAEVIMGKSNRYKYVNQDTYDIHDYISHWTEEEAREYYRRMVDGTGHHRSWQTAYREKFLEEYPTEDDYINKVWAKSNKRK